MADLRTDYLIVGNSAAGVSAAETIRAQDAQAKILIVGDEPYPAYGRPLISYLLEGKTTLEQISFKDDDFYNRNMLDTLLGESYRVTELKPQEHQVNLANGQVIHYEKCLLATGSVPFVPPIPGLDTDTNVFSFMTLDDARTAAQEAQEIHCAAQADNRKSHVLVIGGGLIGLKAAEALSYYVDDVTVFELAPRILPAVLDDAGAVVLASMLEERGITCCPATSTTELLIEDSRVVAASLSDGQVIPCDMVIAAVGVRPASSLATNAGAQAGRGLICGQDLQTSLSDVYAAGDVVQVTDLLDGSQHPLALWPNAIKQGKIAGMHMVESPEAEPFVGGFAVNAVDFYDISLLTGGIINPPENSGYKVITSAESDQYTKFVIKDDVLVGYVLLNRPDNAGIYTALIDQRIPLSSLGANPFEEEPLNIEFPAELRWERLHKCYPSSLDRLGWRDK